MVRRRGFLKATGLALVAAGCTGEEKPRVPSRAARPAAPAAPADWDALARGLAGELIRPDDAAYDQARRLYIPRFDRIRPAGIAYCAVAADVAECVAFARRRGIPVAVRSGGHNYAGWSTGTGLVIDVSPMNRVKAGGGRAVVGAGTRLIALYDELAAAGAALPAGSCATVGIAGLTLGGGLGVVSRAYGLTCDVLEAVRVVTADGRQLKCDARRDADLFWACRGGGGGNFGVAVEFTFRTHRAPEVTTFTLRWPWRRAATVLRGWQGWAPRAPDQVWSSLQIQTRPGGGAPAIEVVGLALGPAAGELDRLIAAVRAEPAERTERPQSYLDAMLLMAGCTGRTIAQCHQPGRLPGQRPEGRLQRIEYSAKSHVALRPLPDAAIGELVARFAAGNDVGDRSALLDALGGAVARVGPGDTAFPHRGALFSIQYLAPGGDREWLRGVHGALDPHLGGAAYVNYIDPDLRDWRRAYYGANYDRLAKVKATYDPGGLFRFPQSVT